MVYQGLLAPCSHHPLSRRRQPSRHGHVAGRAIRRARSRRNRALESETISPIRPTLRFLKHYFCRLKERGHLISHRKLEFIDSLSCDCRRELQLSCFHRDASHGCSLLNVRHSSTQSVPCAYLSCADVSFEQYSFGGFDQCNHGVVLLE